jgi:hypothetical protein
MKGPGCLRSEPGPGEQLPLPVPQIVPTPPKRGTLADALLRELVNGESFTHPDWEARSRSWRLAASVHVLRCLGWPVRTLDISAPTPERPERTIARYGQETDLCRRSTRRPARGV